MLNSAILGVGSNIDAHANIEKARVIISRDQELKKSSAFITTKPVNISVDMNEQPNFLNGAFFIETELDIDGLKDYLKGVEKSLGRSSVVGNLGETPSSERDGARTIDLDIIVFNGEIVSSDFELYGFVRDAVLELAPELRASKV